MRIKNLDNLKPCPFCGGTPAIKRNVQLIENNVINDDINSPSFIVTQEIYCTQCHVYFREYKNADYEKFLFSRCEERI